MLVYFPQIFRLFFILIDLHAYSEVFAMEPNNLLIPFWIDSHKIKFLQIVADAYNYVSLVEAKIDVVMEHKSCSAQRIRMIVRKYAFTYKGRRHRYPEAL